MQLTSFLTDFNGTSRRVNKRIGFILQIVKENNSCSRAFIISSLATMLGCGSAETLGNSCATAVIGAESAVKYSFVLKGMQTRRKGHYNAELTLSPRLCQSGR